MHTDAEGMKASPVPPATYVAGVSMAIAEYTNSGDATVENGFDGLALHAFNCYLVEQFTRPTSNTRQDR